MDKTNKKKLRRWSFAIESGNQGFHLPVVAYGNSAHAERIAQLVAKDYRTLEQFKGKEIVVAKVPHETISQTTQQQLDGLEFELKLTTKALELMFYDVHNPNILWSTITTDEAKRKVLGDYIIKAKEHLIKEYYPEGASSAITDSIEREKQALDNEFRMPLGKKAIEEVLNGTAKDNE